MMYCSFCGKQDNNVLIMIKGPDNTNICNDCVDCCQYVINEYWIYECGRIKRTDGVDNLEEIITNGLFED